MLLLELANCGPSGVLRVFYFLKLILNIVLIVIPIALIVYLTIDFAKMMISSDESAQKKAFNLATKRIIYAVAIFCVPTIVNVVNVLLGEFGVSYLACYRDINIDAINALAADEDALREAKEAARLAKLEAERQEREKEEEDKEYDDNNDTYLPEEPGTGGSLPGPPAHLAPPEIEKPKAQGCDGAVYYSNGTFYRPDSVSSSMGISTRGSGQGGYNKYFYDMLSKFISDAKAAGFDIGLGKGWRSLEDQEYFYCCYQKGLGNSEYVNKSCKGNGVVEKSCNSGNEAAVPGRSNHEFGIASDLEYPKDNREAAVAWAHENAKRYNLEFSVSREDWHIVPDSIVWDNSVVEKCK